MISIKEVCIQSESDYDKLAIVLPIFLRDEDAINVLKKYIGTRCDTVLVEYPYYDSDYLSTYYEHYAQKFRKYPKECCRLHLQRDDEYYGFITIRPTVLGTKIGKTYIDPCLLLDKTAYLMLGKQRAHILGQEFDINCFPWKKQDTDIAVCAHTAVWTVIRYFGNKYKNYADATIGEIVNKIENDWGRKTPSLGLTPVQISDLLKLYGFSPLIISEEKKDQYIFKDEVMAYIESGLPMIGFLHPLAHAVSLMGHGIINYDKLDDTEWICSQVDNEANVIPHSRLIDSVYVMDDRLFPYREVSILPSKESDTEYGINELYHVVVPLYDRMQLTYREVYNRMVLWIKGKKMNWEEFNICRIYITSANSLKRNTNESETMPQILKEILLSLSLPRFVWCIDFAGVENYKKGLTSGCIIVDTTSATLEEDSWILRHDMEKIEYKDYDVDPEEIVSVFAEMKPYSLYQNNLVQIGR